MDGGDDRGYCPGNSMFADLAPGLQAGVRRHFGFTGDDWDCGEETLAWATAVGAPAPAMLDRRV